MNYKYTITSEPVAESMTTVCPFLSTTFRCDEALLMSVDEITPRLMKIEIAYAIIVDMICIVDWFVIDRSKVDRGQ